MGEEGRWHFLRSYVGFIIENADMFVFVRVQTFTSSLLSTAHEKRELIMIFLLEIMTFSASRCLALFTCNPKIRMATEEYIENDNAKNSRFHTENNHHSMTVTVG